MSLNNGVFQNFPRLETPRLILRELNEKDALSIFKMRADGRVNQFIGRNEMTDINNAIILVEKVKSAFKEKRGIAWGGIHRINGELIGTCGFNSINFENNRAEIGGEMSTGYWGKKLAIEAVATLVQFGFDVLNLHSIEAKVSPSNRSAIYLIEQLGFKKEGHFKDYYFFNKNYHDLAIYTRMSDK